VTTVGEAAVDIIYSVDRAGDPIAIIERRLEASQAEVLDHYPGMASGELTTDLARLVNHFAREFRYEVIADPAAFAPAYREQIDSEDPTATWQQDAPRLRDFGMPDLEAIHAPKLDGADLIFFAKERRLGVPYRVVVPLKDGEIGEAVYEPVPMKPL
jgi:hypothetical protein